MAETQCTWLHEGDKASDVAFFHGSNPDCWRSNVVDIPYFHQSIRVLIHNFPTLLLPRTIISAIFSGAYPINFLSNTPSHLNLCNLQRPHPKDPIPTSILIPIAIRFTLSPSNTRASTTYLIPLISSPSSAITLPYAQSTRQVTPSATKKKRVHDKNNIHGRRSTEQDKRAVEHDKNNQTLQPSDQGKRAIHGEKMWVYCFKSAG